MKYQDNNIIREAFTLVELLVVMGIIGSVMVLGIWGMLSLQRTVELQQASSDINAILKETRSKAENNVFPASFTVTDNVSYDDVYAYSVRFGQDAEGLSYVGRDLCIWNDPNWDCTEIDGSLNPENIFTDIKYVSSGEDDLCAAIMFVNLTGDMLIDNGSGGYITDGTCDIFIKHMKSDKGVTLRVDGVTNKYTIESL